MITYARIASTVLIFMLCFNNPLRGDGLFSGTPSGDPFSAQDSSGGVVISHGFTVGDTDLFVTDLGVWDQFQDGLNFSYSVGIFDLGGLIFSTDIQSGTTSELIGEFRYESINTVVLESANEYVLAAFYSQNTDDIYVRDSLSNVVTSGNLADEITLTGGGISILENNLVFVPPNDNDIRLGPNLQFTTVPEPCSFPLAFICLLQILTIRMRK